MIDGTWCFSKQLLFFVPHPRSRGDLRPEKQEEVVKGSWRPPQAWDSETRVSAKTGGQGPPFSPPPGGEWGGRGSSLERSRKTEKGWGRPRFRDHHLRARRRQIVRWPKATTGVLGRERRKHPVCRQRLPLHLMVWAPDERGLGTPGNCPGRARSDGVCESTQ